MRLPHYQPTNDEPSEIIGILLVGGCGVLVVMSALERNWDGLVDYG